MPNAMWSERDEPTGETPTRRPRSTTATDAVPAGGRRPNATRHLTRWLAPALAAGLLVAGCSNKTETTTAGAGGSSTTAPATTATSAATSTTAGKTVKTDEGAYPTTTKAGSGDYGKDGKQGEGDDTGTTVAGGVPANGVVVNKASSSVGEITVDGKGMTLYAFKNDTGSESTCTGGCTTAWPPFVGPVETAGDGIQLASMGTTTRADGTRQVTYKGHPLYHFSGDEKPGDTNGQGVGGIWWAMGADGEPTTKK